MSERLPTRRARAPLKRADEEFLSSPDLSEDDFDELEDLRQKRPSKRKRITVDLDAIEDPVERRIQKQRAKNRCDNCLLGVTFCSYRHPDVILDPATLKPGHESSSG
jgi:hypothetical protein